MPAAFASPLAIVSPDGFAGAVTATVTLTMLPTASAVANEMVRGCTLH